MLSVQAWAQSRPGCSPVSVRVDRAVLARLGLRSLKMLAPRSGWQVRWAGRKGIGSDSVEICAHTMKYNITYPSGGGGGGERGQGGAESDQVGQSL
eukprot:7142440-Pyramimonas_sp.AAC.1